MVTNTRHNPNGKGGYTMTSNNTTSRNSSENKEALMLNSKSNKAKAMVNNHNTKEAPMYNKVSIKQINDTLAKEGFPDDQLVKDYRHFHFDGPTAVRFESSTVEVQYLYQMSLDEWIEEFYTRLDEAIQAGRIES